jgi:DNA mismatch endonuclease (patch repair protein)
MMSAIRGKDSKAEIALRRELHRRGLRYRLHARDVLGKPDLVVRSRKVAVFVDGDFWHGNAHRLRGLDRLEDLFPTNCEWWMKKLRRNMERDREVTTTLRSDGWQVVRVWESDVLSNPARTADIVEAAMRVS